MKSTQRISIALGLLVFAFAVPASAAQAESPAAPPTVPSKQSDRPAAAEKGTETKPEHFRIGPIVGVGFPRPLAVEAFAKFERIVGAGVEYSFLPTVTVLNARTNFQAVALDLRVFPFKGAFFIGARAGRQWLAAATSLDAGRYGSFAEQMHASTWFLNPRAGFLYTFESGITLGIDAGVQVPIAPQYRRTGDATDLGYGDSTVEQSLVLVSNALGNATTPTVDLFRLGFLF